MIYSDSLSDTLSGILSDTLSAIQALTFYLAFFLTFYLTFDLAFYLTFSLDILFGIFLPFYLPGPAGNTGHGCSQLRSGTKHSWMLTLEVRQGTLGVDARG